MPKKKDTKAEKEPVKTDANETPIYPFGRGKLRGALSNPGFTKDNQPSPEAKKAGKFRAKTLREFLSMAVTDKMTPEFERIVKSICKIYGVERSVIDHKLLIELSIAKRAIKEGDESAYKTLMERAFGKPRTEGWDAPPPQVEDAPDRQKSQIDFGGGTIFEV